MPSFGPEREVEMCLIVRLAHKSGEGGALLPFSMETSKGDCPTGGLISMGDPSHPRDHYGVVWHCDRRLSSHGGKGAE